VGLFNGAEWADNRVGRSLKRAAKHNVRHLTHRRRDEAPTEAGPRLRPYC
jgi:hypothetical protein